MSDIQEKHNALEYALNGFVAVCDEAEAAFRQEPYRKREECAFPALLDALCPLPVDRNAVEGTSYRQLESLVGSCTKCRLAQTRTHVVFGEGSVPARLMVIGEGPGADEDATGRPFVGKAGQYLDKWLAGIQLARNNGVFIANIVKCRPLQNRDPHPDEVSACIPYLKRQVQLVKPQIILLVGSVAAKTLLDTTDGVTKLRGRFYRYEGIPVMVTYHPAAVLRNEAELRRPVWEDLKKVASFLGIALPGRS